MHRIIRLEEIIALDKGPIRVSLGVTLVRMKAAPTEIDLEYLDNEFMNGTVFRFK